MHPVRIVSANVNGIRAAQRRGGLTWLSQSGADVIALQEVRANEAQATKAMDGEPIAEWSRASEEGLAAGRAGVSILTPWPILAERDSEVLGDVAGGRWIEADIAVGEAKPVTVISAYVHTGEAGTGKQGEKYAFLQAITGRLKELRDQGVDVVLTGDLNICHTDLDLNNTKGNVGKAGYLPQEQAYLSQWADLGYVDAVRAIAGERPGPYSWWSWRGQAFDNDTGWRIDYQWASPALRAKDATIGRATSYEGRWSDHAPVVVDYER